ILRGRGALQPDGGCVQGNAPRLDHLPAGHHRRTGCNAPGGPVKPFDGSGVFRPNADGGGLRRLAVRGAGVTVVSQSLWFTVAMSVTIFFTCLSVQHLALLKRAMRFSAVSANDILARSISVAVSVLLASAGWGYWALVAGAVALALSTSIGAWALCRWVPALPRRGVSTVPMVLFAMNTDGRFVMDYLTRKRCNHLVV